MIKKNVLTSQLVLPTKAIFVISMMLTLLMYSTCSSRVSPELTPEEQNPDDPNPDDQTPDAPTPDDPNPDAPNPDDQTPERHSVTFNTNGGSEVELKEVNSGDTVAKPDNPTREAFVFGNWFTDNALTKIYSFSAPVTSDLTLYAKWISEDATIYQVAFNTRGGSNVSTQRIVEGETVNKPNKPTKTDSTFVNWFTDNALTNIYNFSAPVTSGLTLYAKWTLKDVTTYEVAFNTGGGSNVKTQRIVEAETANKPPDPTWDGYRFDDWYSAPNSLDEPYDFDDEVTDNITLYANWVKTFVVTFNEGAGVNTRGATRTSAEESNETALEVVDSSATISAPETPTLAGHRFAGWYISPALSGDPYVFDDTKVIGDINLYAKWVQAFTVTFNSKGGSEVLDIFVDINNQGFSKPSDPTQVGYAFRNWYSIANSPNTAYDFNTPLRQDITLYANWTATFLVIFNTNGGSEVQTQNVIPREMVTKPTDPSPPSPSQGRFFGGWFTENDFDDEDKYNFNSLVTENITLYAKWEYMVTYDLATRTITGLNPILSGNNIELVIPSEIVIPSAEINRVPMEIIADNAFYNNLNITSLEITEGIMHIGSHAFAFGELTRNSAEELGRSTHVFKYRNANPRQSRIGETLVIPSSVVTIGAGAFSRCSALTGLTFQGNLVDTIGAGAFAGCTGFRGILTIPTSVDTIGEGAFYECRNFTSGLTIPESVKAIGYGAFAHCSNLSSLDLGTSVTTIGARAFHYCEGLMGPLTIPNTILTIGEGTFDHCSMLSSLDLGATVKTIGDFAFNACSGFTIGLTIPTSVNTIGDSAFAGCVGFSSLDLGTIKTIGRFAFNACSGFTGVLTIPNSVKTIGEWAFNSCSGFRGELTIPNSVDTIGAEAFKNCSGFNGSLTIPANIRTIGNSTFEGCTGFDGSLTIGNSVVTIGAEAFKNCSKMIGNLIIPTSVETIGDEAFYGMKNIDTFVFLRPDASVVSFQVKVFDSIGRGIFDGIDIDKLVISFPSPNAIIYVFRAGSPHPSGDPELFFYYRTLRKYHFRVPGNDRSIAKSRVVFRSRN